MKILEFGDISKRRMILIHGFQSPWQVWDEYIRHYEQDYHIIVPILPGHDPESKEEFTSFEQAAAELEEYIISRYGNEIYMVFGMSMGGVLTATLWQNRRLRFDKVIFDGSPLVSFGGFMERYMRSFYLSVTHKSQQRDKIALKNAVKSVIPQHKLPELLGVLDNMTDTTINNSIHSIAGFRLSENIDTPDTEVFYFHGTSLNEALAKKTARYLLRGYPSTRVKCFKGKFHCEYSLFQPERMIKELDSILM